MHISQQKESRHTLAVMVDNEPGILARIAGL
ncbi:MAG: acetolactate synthase small subunit, partial [Sphingomonas sp.]